MRYRAYGYRVGVPMWAARVKYARVMVRAFSRYQSAAGSLAWWRYRRAHPYIVDKDWAFMADWIRLRVAGRVVITLLRIGDWTPLGRRPPDRGRLATADHYGAGADRP